MIASSRAMAASLLASSRSPLSCGRRRTKAKEICRKAGLDLGLLRMAQEIRWAGTVRDEAPEEREEENRWLKKLVADLALDKEMLQGVIR
jgi:putative transposase